MARGKKGRSSNKKKQKGRGGGKAGGPAVAFGGFGAKIPSNVLQGETPDFEELNRPIRVHDGNYSSFYARYKQATKRFVDYMKGMCPEEVRGEIWTSDSIAKVAKWMKREQKAVPFKVLRDLQLAIRIRTRVAKQVYGGGDSGHKHFNEVLTFCWSILKRLPKAKEYAYSISHVPQVQKENINFIEEANKLDLIEETDYSEEFEEEENRFAALGEFDLEADDDDDEEIFPTSSIPCPEPESEPTSLDDLMQAEDRMDAMLFLQSLDELMGHVSQQYKLAHGS